MADIEDSSYMSDKPMNIVAICNQKGGVGKTTLTINLGAALADRGLRVLLIDLDPQGHLTEGVGLHEQYLSEEPSLYDSLVDAKRKVRLTDLIRPHAKEPYSVIPASYQLMLVEQALYMTRNREHKLKGLLTELDGQFDWVLIDCPPALGNLTDNALNAARQLVVPIQAEATSVRALELLFDQIESIEQGLKIRVYVLAVVPNLVQDSALSKRILSDLQRNVPRVAPTVMRKRVILQAAWSDGRSIFAYESRSRAEEQNKAEVMELYRQLADYVIDQIEESHRG
jgi:chromosome partitioning protein